MSGEFKGTSLYDYAAYITNIADFAVQNQLRTEIKSIKTAAAMITQLLSGIQDIYKITATEKDLLVDSRSHIDRVLNAIQGRCRRAMDLQLMLIHDVMYDNSAIGASDILNAKQDDLIAIYKVVDHETMDIKFESSFIDVDAFLQDDSILVTNGIVKGRVRPDDHVWLAYKYNDANWEIVSADDVMSSSFYNFVRREHAKYLNGTKKTPCEDEEV